MKPCLPLLALLLVLCVGGCGKGGCDPTSLCIDPREYGTEPVYVYDDGILVMVEYYSDHGNEDRLCGVVSDALWTRGDIEAWSLRDNWKHHHFNTLMEAQEWLSKTWCKP